MKAKVNSKSEFVIEHDALTDAYTINGVPVALDILKLSPTTYHLIKNNKSYTVAVIDSDLVTKTFTVKINHEIHKVELKDRYDDLLQQLGFDKHVTTKVNEIKAPMPGLVKDILVTEGQQLTAGDSVIILEAMKMENVLKCPADVVVKSIKVKKGATVEKNEVMIMLA
jgi:acetyl/propionyl-CoA carboxylase alpha subunit